MRNLTLWQALAYATELGIALAAAVVVGLLVGSWVDERMGNEMPIFAIIGSLLGLASGVYSTIRIAQIVTRPRKE
jgi:F0F1-type ATP synthase assembly protein I